MITVVKKNVLKHLKTTLTVWHAPLVNHSTFVGVDVKHIWLQKMIPPLVKFLAEMVCFTASVKRLYIVKLALGTVNAFLKKPNSKMTVLGSTKKL